MYIKIHIKGFFSSSMNYIYLYSWTVSLRKEITVSIHA